MRALWTLRAGRSRRTLGATATVAAIITVIAVCTGGPGWTTVPFWSLWTCRALRTGWAFAVFSVKTSVSVYIFYQVFLSVAV